MFEYLMLLRRHPGGLLAESEHAAVDAHRRFARDAGIPWGMSESGFASLDPSHATALALLARPHDAVANLRELERLGMLGLYGMYEAARLSYGARDARGSIRSRSVLDGASPGHGARGHHQCAVQRHARAALPRRPTRADGGGPAAGARASRASETEAARSHERAEAAARRPVPALPEAWDPAGLLVYRRCSCWATAGCRRGSRRAAPVYSTGRVRPSRDGFLIPPAITAASGSTCGTRTAGRSGPSDGSRLELSQTRPPASFTRTWRSFGSATSHRHSDGRRCLAGR